MSHVITEIMEAFSLVDYSVKSLNYFTLTLN